MNPPELEISLLQRDAASYAVQARLSDPDNDDADKRVEAYPVRFDFDRLLALTADSKAYGKLLFEFLFGQPQVRNVLDLARALAQNGPEGPRSLRLRLCIDRWSLPLHSQRWETLCDPASGRVLLTDDTIHFSRHLSSFDMRPVRLRSRTRLRALAAIANPSNLSAKKPNGRTLGALDVSGELARVRSVLTGMDVIALNDSAHVTLDALREALRDDYDVFYLVCHGAYIDSESKLWLEDEKGETKVTPGRELVDGLAGLIRLPRLVVLASCQSAGTGQDITSDDEGVLSALGPLMAEAGVPAVIAMQGNVLQSTFAAFIAKFFEELLKDGQIDRAVSVARFAVRGAGDFWAPVLYTRLLQGRLWYDQSFSDNDAEIWAGLRAQIENGTLIPILGAGILEPYFGPVNEIVRNLIKKYNYPMASGYEYDLPQIVLYLSTIHGKANAIEFVAGEMITQLLRRWPALNADKGPAKKESSQEKLLRLLSRARELALAGQSYEPHRLLARMNCSLYVTSNLDNLLANALTAEGRKPREERSAWHEAEPESSPDELTSEEPLIYRLFGHFSDRRSIILSEDEYFSYLIGITRLQGKPKPSPVLSKLADAGLLFLGFRIQDWDFRTFSQFLQSMPGSLRGDYTSVAVQLTPEEGMGGNRAKAQRYLERYFNSKQVKIYWGSVEEFLKVLNP